MEADFEQVDQVDQQGEFAHRGGIVDIFPLSVSQPIRVEFFGDQIESIRRFNLDTQRSTDQIEICDLTSPAAGRQFDGGEASSLLDYLDDERIVCIVEPSETRNLAREFYRRMRENDIPVIVHSGTGHFGQTGQMGVSAFRPVGGGLSLAVPREFVVEADQVAETILGDDWKNARLIDIEP